MLSIEDVAATFPLRHSGLDPESIVGRSCWVPVQVRDGIRRYAPHTSLPGGNRALEPPDPIPNSAVKRCIADGSAVSRARVGHCQASFKSPVECSTGLFSFPAGSDLIASAHPCARRSVCIPAENCQASFRSPVEFSTGLFLFLANNPWDVVYTAFHGDQKWR